MNGRLPKNVYGNLDVYVPSMVPQGAIHLKHPETQRAARFLGIDYADAVTGFVFKGRHGTAIINGAVIAIEHAEAVQQLLRGFADERADEEDTKRSVEALRIWKRFFLGLRIRERIEGYNIEGDNGATLDPAIGEDGRSNYEGEGGFLPDSGMESIAEPTAGGWIASNEKESDEDTGGGFLAPSLIHNSHDHGAHHEPVTKSTESRKIGDFLGSGDSALQKELGTDLNTAGHLSPSTSVKTNATQHASSVADHLDLESEDMVLPEAESDLNNQATSRMAFSELGIAHEDLEEATILQQSYDLGRTASQSQSNAQREKRQSPGFSPSPRVSTLQNSDILDSAVALEIPPQASSSSPRSIPQGSQVRESNDDSDSLLLEDPSDEDADPEWIA